MTIQIKNIGSRFEFDCIISSPFETDEWCVKQFENRCQTLGEMGIL